MGPLDSGNKNSPFGAPPRQLNEIRQAQANHLVECRNVQPHTLMDFDWSARPRLRLRRAHSSTPIALNARLGLINAPANSAASDDYRAREPDNRDHRTPPPPPPAGPPMDIVKHSAAAPLRASLGVVNRQPEWNPAHVIRPIVWPRVGPVASPIKCATIKRGAGGGGQLSMAPPAGQVGPNCARTCCRTASSSVARRNRRPASRARDTST